jgi:hypothetical protein
MALLTGSSLLFGILPERPALLESLGYQINGLVVIFLALGLIWSVTELVGLYFKKQIALAEARAEAVPTAPPFIDTQAEPKAKSNGHLPLELVVAITAAVKVVLRDRRHKVHGISTHTDWAREGRRQIFASHKVR